MLHKTRQGDSKLILMIAPVVVNDDGDGGSSYAGNKGGNVSWCSMFMVLPLEVMVKSQVCSRRSASKSNLCPFFALS